MYGQYGSVQTRATQICITRPFEKFWSWCKNRANLTSRESLCNVWARFESYKSGPSLVDKVLIRWHQRRIKKMPLECDWLVWSWDRLALAVHQNLVEASAHLTLIPQLKSSHEDSSIQFSFSMKKKTEAWRFLSDVSGSQEVFLVHHPSELKEEDFAHCVEQWRVEKEVVMRHWCEVSLKLTCKLGPILNPSLRRGV
ncbi:hypothetical protein Bca101_100775 [Brassica carinata]